MSTAKHLFIGGLIVALAFVISGCAYMHVQMPMDDNFDSTRLGTKEGRASARSILWLVAWGDAGTKAAANQGGIAVIHHADTDVKTVLAGAYWRMTTVVYGD